MAYTQYLDEEWTEQFCDLIRHGNHIATAAGAMSVPRQRVYEWLNDGQDESSPAHKFFLAVWKADADLEVELTKKWYEIALKAGARDFKAIQQLLQARFRENWGEVKQVNVTGQVSHQLQKPDLSKLSPLDLQKFIDNAEHNRKLIESASGHVDRLEPKLKDLRENIIDAEFTET